MIRIEVGNSTSTVTGTNLEQLRALRRECSYQVKTGRRVPVKTKGGGRRWILEILRHNLMDKSGLFPSGLLNRVVNLCAKNKWPWIVQDLRIEPTIAPEALKAKFEYLPRIEQSEAALEALKQARGIIAFPTGTGKSAIVALICQAIGLKTLVVTPGLGLKEQLTQSLTEAFGEVYVGSLADDRLICVENVQALDPGHKLKGFDCVIIDEFHHGAAETYRQLNLKAWTDVYFKIGLTATPFRGNKDERLLLESLLADVIYRLEYHDAVDKGYIVPVEAYYIDLPKETKRKTYNSYHAAYKTRVVQNKERNQLIADMVANIIAANKSAIILTKQIEHGEKIQDLLVDLGHFVQFAEGKNDLKMDFIRAFCNCTELALIGTVGVLGEGVDTKPAEYIFIAGGGKSKIQFMQSVGRGVRTFQYPDGTSKVSCKVILVRDQNNHWLEDHFDECVKHLEQEYGVIPVKLDHGT